CSARDARRLVELASRHGAPLFSSSSLRYAPDVVRHTENGDGGGLLGVFACGPGTLNTVDPQTRNPGLYHYGIHTTEMLYALMGPGCQRVSCVHEKDVDVVTGQWKDGRVAGIRCIRAGASPYVYTAFTKDKVENVPVSTAVIYRELLKKAVYFFE